MATGTTTPTIGVRVEDSRRSRQVWLVLVLCNMLFFALCVAGAISIYNFLSTITVPQTASLEPRHGTQLAVLRKGSRVPELATGRTELHEGDTALSGQDSEGFIQLFEGTSTIQTYFSTTLRIDSLRVTRFFQNVKQARLHLDTGTVVWATGGLGDYASAEYIITSDEAEITIPNDSKVRVRVEKDEANRKTTYAIVDYGSAVMLSRGRRIELNPETMAWVGPDGQPQGPVQAEEELIRNGTFNEPPTSGAEMKDNGGLDTAAWLPVRDPSSDVVFKLSTISVVSETLPGLGSIDAAVICLRDENCPGADHGGNAGDRSDSDDGRYGRVGIRQDINQPVEFFNSIELKVAVKVVRQSLPAGGPQGNLFPLTIRVVYSDTEGNVHEWKHSFYYLAAEKSLPNATRVSPGSWLPEQQFTIKSAEVGRDVAVINSIEIYGYGQQFQSWVTGVSMVAR